MLTPTWCFDEPNLSASVDDSMSGIGTDFVGSMFNMRDALSALPLCDEPTFLLDEISCDSQDCPVSTCSAHSIRNSSYNFETVLKASTSSATKYTEPSLTYLNQGQTYELIMHWNSDKATPTKSVIKICFHDYRMELKERELLESWRQSHPGERLLDIELSRSSEYEDLYVDPSNPNTVVCLWSTRQCSVGIRLNCIGTEFTAKKHGGEKGVPFRLQIDYFDAESETYVESCAAQVKVFRLKGADRKHKTDREKLERKTEDSRALYQPSCPVTKLSRFRNSRLTERLKSQSSIVSPGADRRDSRFSDPPSNTSSKEAQCDRVSPSPEPGKLEENAAPPRSTVTSNEPSANKVEPTVVKASSNGHFITPSQPFQRPVPLVRPPRSSPVPAVSIAPSQLSPHSRRHPANVTINWQRRRRPRVSDCCTSNCSTCGRCCRGHSGRWIRVNKNRSCAHVEAIGLRSKQSTSWLPEKRRASHSYERTSAVVHVPKSDTLDVSPAKDAFEVDIPVRMCELSTSAESSCFGNEDEEFRKWTIVDHRRCDESDSGFDCQTASEHQTKWFGGATDFSSSVDCLEPEYQRKLMRTTSSLITCSQSEWELPVSAHNMDAQPERTSLLSQMSSVETSDNNHSSYVHATMTSEDVVEWLRASSFANLVEKFRTFTGRDMLRLTKEDFFLLCGAVEGLRLYNALYSRPARPRCTLYLSRKEKVVFQAVLLYELTKAELVRSVASITTLPSEQIHMLCLLTAHNLPVLLTDELIAQLEDQSCYQIEVHWHSERKANVFLRPV